MRGSASPCVSHEIHAGPCNSTRCIISWLSLSYLPSSNHLHLTHHSQNTVYERLRVGGGNTVLEYSPARVSRRATISRTQNRIRRTRPRPCSTLPWIVLQTWSLVQRRCLVLESRIPPFLHAEYTHTHNTHTLTHTQHTHTTHTHTHNTHTHTHTHTHTCSHPTSKAWRWRSSWCAR